MQVSNNDLKNTMNNSLSLNMKKQEKVNEKENAQALQNNYKHLNTNNTNNLNIGKTAQKLDELNKQKVTPALLEEAVTELKKDNSSKESNTKGEISEASQSSGSKKSKVIDPRDKNRDGKVSQAEKLEAEQKKDEKVLGLIKEVIGELKKDDGFTDIKPEQFKGISKMINSDIIDDKNSKNINKFLDN